MRIQIPLLIFCCFLMGCSSSEEPTTIGSDPINYETLQGGWRIIEIYANDAEQNELLSLISDENSAVYASLFFYRPTLGDPARLEMSWHCNGLGFSYEYANNLSSRIGDVNGPLGPWSNDGLQENAVYYPQIRLSCPGPALGNEQENSNIAVLMSRLAERLTLFETYETDFQMEGDIVSIFTSEGDGIYGMRL